MTFAAVRRAAMPAFFLAMVNIVVPTFGPVFAGPLDSIMFDNSWNQPDYRKGRVRSQLAKDYELFAGSLFDKNIVPAIAESPSASKELKALWVKARNKDLRNRVPYFRLMLQEDASLAGEFEALVKSGRDSLLAKFLATASGFSDLNEDEKTLVRRVRIMSTADAGERLQLLLELSSSISAPAHIVKEHYEALYGLAYRLGNFEVAYQALAEAIRKGRSFTPWDAAFVAEVYVRAGHPEKAAVKLTEAVQGMHDLHCSVEPHWEALLEELANGDNATLVEQLRTSSEPWAYFPLIEAELKLIEFVQPLYPEKMAKRKIGGVTVFSIIVNADGHVDCANAMVDIGGAAFSDQARKASLKSRYIPHMVRGVSRRAYGVRQVYVFHMERDASVVVRK